MMNIKFYLAVEFIQTGYKVHLLLIYQAFGPAGGCYANIFLGDFANSAAFIFLNCFGRTRYTLWARKYRNFVIAANCVHFAHI